jgi:hypothetical protein
MDKKPGWCLNGPEDTYIENGSTYVCIWFPEGTRELCSECVYFRPKEEKED